MTKSPCGSITHTSAHLDLSRLVHRSILMELADDILLVLDENGFVLDANEAARKIHDLDCQDIIGINVVDYIHPDSHADFFAFTGLIGDVDGSMRRRLKCRRGQVATRAAKGRGPDDETGDILWLDVKASWSAEMRRFYVVERDVSADVARTRELRELSERLTEQALTDGLTGLQNRSAFEDRLAVPIREEGECLVIVDVDRFKQINDGWGHVVGDAVLRGVAERLRAGLREDEFAARIGGDEFVVIFGGDCESDAVRARLETLRLSLAEVHQVDGRSISATCSLGAALAGAGDAGEAWYRRADGALYCSKADGRNAITLA